MDLELKGRSALITGASKGIGRAVALALAREGCLLHLAARGREELEAVARDVASTGAPQPHIHPCDLSRRGTAVALAQECGALDILVNNAGAIPRGTVSTRSEERRVGKECRL